MTGPSLDVSEITIDARDWLTDTRRMAMSLEAEGAFVRLLFWAQIDPDHPGSLEDNDTVLAQLSKAGDRWPAIRAQVRAQFQIDEDTKRLFWPAQRERLDAEIESRQRRRDAGSLGGRSKAQNRRAAKSEAEMSPDDLVWEQIKKAYPERVGGQNWRDARAGFNARRRQGVEGGDMLAGAERYKVFCDATKRTGTEYVKQASTFFGRGEHWREKWDLPAGYIPGSNGKPERESLAARQFRSIHERK